MKNVLLLLCAFLGLSGCHAAQDGDTIDNSTVSVFDVRRFMGKWYEIARYDHRFEKGMTHVTATYSLQENGSIKVKNEGYKNGKQEKGAVEAVCLHALPECFYLWRRLCDRFASEEKICR